MTHIEAKSSENWLRYEGNHEIETVVVCNHSFSFIVCFISQPIFIGFCFNMGHFEAIPGGQNLLGSYSNSRMQWLTNSYSNFEFYSYSLDALVRVPWPWVGRQCSRRPLQSVGNTHISASNPKVLNGSIFQSRDLWMIESLIMIMMIALQRRPRKPD